ncbi:hypothetical protein V8E36_009444 [Tilletia maclaganii]
MFCTAAPDATTLGILLSRLKSSKKKQQEQILESASIVHIQYIKGHAHLLLRPFPASFFFPLLPFHQLCRTPAADPKLPSTMQFNLNLLLLCATAAATAAESINYTKPEARVSSGGGSRAQLYARADPLNLFGIRGPSAAAADESVGWVLDPRDSSSGALARGMKLEERQRTCSQSGYGLCPDQSGCCPIGGQCCPGRICCSPTQGTCSRVFNSYECCLPGISCNGIDGCATGRRACSRDVDACCPTGASCLYDSSGKAYGCSGSGSGGSGGTGDNGSGQSVSASASTSASSSITFLTQSSATATGAIQTFPTESLSLTTPSQSSFSIPTFSFPTSTASPASGGGGGTNPFGGASAAVPRAQSLAGPLVAVVVAMVVGALAI